VRPTATGVVLAASLAVNLGFAVAAGSRRRDPERAFPPAVLASVPLDDAQRARVVALEQRIAEVRALEAARLGDLRGRLAGLVTRDVPDPVAIDRVVADIADVEAGLHHRVASHVVSVRAELRPEQLGAFDTLVDRQLRAGAPFEADAAGTCRLAR
jgi:hypothetical protein